MLRRSFLKGLGATLFIAPSIVHAENLMTIKEYAPPVPSWCPPGWLPMDGREIKKKFYPDLYNQYTKLRFPLTLHNAQDFSPVGDYEWWKKDPKMVTVISAMDMRRSNGSLMRAGASHDLLVRVVPKGEV